MSYRVRIDSFEGPFDLLLYLVSRQRVDIGSISIAEIVDQYLASIELMRELDLDVASDFLLVAATLLDIKAESLIPDEPDDVADELEELSPEDARDILVQRLIAYKQYKNAAAALGARYELEGRMHPRLAGPDPEFLGRMPDYLKSTTLDSLALLAADAMARREVFLLESEHIAAKPIPVETHVRAIHRRISVRKHLMFSELLAEAPSIPVRVVSFLAVLELYKRTMVNLEQPEPFADIAIDYIEGSGELVFTDEDDAQWAGEGLGSDDGPAEGEEADSDGADETSEMNGAGETAGSGEAIASDAEGAARDRAPLEKGLLEEGAGKHDAGAPEGAPSQETER